MKKVLILALTLSLLLSCVPMAVSATTYTPDGAISTAEEFKNMDPAGTYYLANDINFNGEDFNGCVISSFTGTLDGKGHAVYGYDLAAAANMGLFMSLSGSVSNIKVGTQANPITITAIISGSTVGALAAYRGGSLSLENVEAYVNISITENGGVIGGIIGVIENPDVAVNCTTEGTINVNSATSGAWAWVGGIAGQLKDGAVTFTNCVNLANISVTTPAQSYVGGIVCDSNAKSGRQGSATFSYCANFGSLTAVNSGTDTTCYAGGIMASAANVNAAVAFNSCYNFGNVTSDLQAGGILGYNAAGKTTSITGCTNKGTITGAADKFGNFYGENADTGSALTMDNATVPAAHTATVGVQDSSTFADLRFIASVDALTYTNAGVVGVATWTVGSETKTWSFKHDFNTVYTSILSHENGQSVSTAESGKYLMALVLTSVPDGAVINLTSYVEDASGTTYGDTVKVTNSTSAASIVDTVTASAAN